MVEHLIIKESEGIYYALYDDVLQLLPGKQICMEGVVAKRVTDYTEGFSGSWSQKHLRIPVPERKDDLRCVAQTFEG